MEHAFRCEAVFVLVDEVDLQIPFLDISSFSLVRHDHDSHDGIPVDSHPPPMYIVHCTPTKLQVLSDKPLCPLSGLFIH